MSDMAINPTTWKEPTTKGDVSGIAIKVALALSGVVGALEKLSHGDKDIQTEIETVETKAREIAKIFDEMTGWTDDGRDQ
jgi:hypothetical protein